MGFIPSMHPEFCKETKTELLPLLKKLTNEWLQLLESHQSDQFQTQVAYYIKKFHREGELYYLHMKDHLTKKISVNPQFFS